MTDSRRVQKFRTIEAMNAASVDAPQNPGFEQFLRHCARYWAMTKRIYPRGVFKFRSIEEAQRARDRHAVPPDAPAESRKP
jgi:hypothetical protein